MSGRGWPSQASACNGSEPRRREPHLGVAEALADLAHAAQKQVTLPLFAIFKPKYLFNTFTGIMWMAANFCAYYSVWAMLGTYLTKELGWTPAQASVPVFWGNIITFVSCAVCGGMSERLGGRWALIIPLTIAMFLVPLYIGQTDRTWFLVYFLLFICFFGGKDALNPGRLSERFPTEVRAPAAGFIYHQGAVWGRGRGGRRLDHAAVLGRRLRPSRDRQPDREAPAVASGERARAS